MVSFLSGIKSEKLYQYLFLNQEFTLKQDYYYMKIIELNKPNDFLKIMEFIEEMVSDSIFLEIDNSVIMFYFEEIDVNFKEIFSWISDDFGINLKVFSSSKLNFKEPKYFHNLYNLYQKYLKTKPFAYFSITDLILEIIKNNIDDLKVIKPIILNSVFQDIQLEKLIISMFENNLNVTKTAQAIYMHRNTVINKLEYIKSQTSLNIQNFTDALCMYWLIKTK